MRGPRSFFDDGSGGLAVLGALAVLAMACAFFATAPFVNRDGAMPVSARRRAALFAGVAIVAVAAAGCHKSKAPDPSTPAGIYAFSVQASATDASGNAFNASRSVQLNLDVVQGAASTGFGSQ